MNIREGGKHGLARDFGKEAKSIMIVRGTRSVLLEVKSSEYAHCNSC